MGDLVGRLGDANRSLLRRVLEFADDLNAEIIEALAPRLAVVPFSLGRNRHLNDVGHLGLSLKQATDVGRHTVQLPEGAFRFHTGMCRRGKVLVRTVFVRHPASLRLSSDSKKRLVEDVALILRAFQSGNG
jgi:hypothetical protein